MFSNPTKILGFDDRLLALTGVFINTHSVMAIYYTGAFFNVDFGIYVLKWFGEFTVVLLLWIIIRWLYLELLKRRSGLKNMRTRLCIIPTFLIPYFLISIWFILYIQPYFDWPYAQYQDPEVSVQIATGAVIFFLDIGLYEALHLFVELKNTKIREEKLKKENVTTQLANLRNQISPHFLFNSLNTLVYLIDKDKEKSKEFVHKLSYIYKTILDSSKKDLVSVREE
ncbi:MAG: histidine kinase, partial [Bacteroidota bacterium]